MKYPMQSEKIRVFVCGDVMIGRGIDQILGHPGDPEIHEACLKDARDYVRLAEEVNGEIPRRVAGSYLWEKIFLEWQKRLPMVKVINLETAITTSNHHWTGKGVNYRMHPANVDVLTSAQIDICVLANNHVMDWCLEGFRETLGTLGHAGIKYAGAGENLAEAMAPAVLSLSGDRRLLVFSMGALSSGIPQEWGATPDRPGIHLLEEGQ